MELRSFRCQDVVIAKVASSLCALGNIVTLFNHVCWHCNFWVSLIIKDIWCILSDNVGVESDGPITFNHKVDLRDVSLLLNDVAIICCGLVVSWHEPESNLVDEVTFDFWRNREEKVECRLLHNILKQKLCHNYVLNFEGNRVKVLAPFQQDWIAVILPKMLKVSFDHALQLMRDVLTSFVRLISNVFDHGKPVCQLNFRSGPVVTQRLNHNLNELVHQDWKDWDTDDLNYDSDDFLSDRRGKVISVANSG